MALEEAMRQRACSAAEIARAKALWQEFVATSVGTTGRSPPLVGSVESWCAALHYLVVPLSGRPLTQREVGALYHTSASTLSSRVKVLKAYTDQTPLPAGVPPTPRRRRPAARSPQRPTAGASEKVLARAQTLARPATPPALDDSTWIAIFRGTHRLLSPLYGDKTHIDIVHYLSHVELNLALAGYTVARELIRDQFGKVFSRLGLQPAKGRDPHKFVYLEDVFGSREPFVLLKLEYEDA